MEDNSDKRRKLLKLFGASAYSSLYSISFYLQTVEGNSINGSKSDLVDDLHVAMFVC